MLLSQLLSLIGIVVVAGDATVACRNPRFISSSSLADARSCRDKDGGSGLAPLTVLVPAHNEEALIGRCIRSVLASASSGVDVLVVAHNCTDATAVRAEAAGAHVLVLNDPGQTG